MNRYNQGQYFKKYFESLGGFVPSSMPFLFYQPASITQQLNVNSLQIFSLLRGCVEAIKNGTCLVLNISRFPDIVILLK